MEDQTFEDTDSEELADAAESADYVMINSVRFVQELLETSDDPHVRELAVHYGILCGEEEMKAIKADNPDADLSIAVFTDAFSLAIEILDQQDAECACAEGEVAH